MNIINAKDYSQRGELENKVRNLIGLTAEIKSDYEIHGKRGELARLQLSDTTMFWGIKCVITDMPTEVKTQKETEKPQRGEIKEFGLNRNLKKPK